MGGEGAYEYRRNSLCKAPWPRERLKFSGIEKKLSNLDIDSVRKNGTKKSFTQGPNLRFRNTVH